MKFILALTFNREIREQSVLAGFERVYGVVDMESPTFDFAQTNYYREEMGSALRKKFVSFRALCARDKLVEWKYLALELEAEFAKQGRRRVNIDPAYLELAKLVVASTKNFAHRVYIGRGIFGDVQLRYQKGGFVTQEWTYPDYATPVALSFFGQTREIYYKQLQSEK